MNEPIRSELWALEALEKTGKESLEMSQNQPGDPGEKNETREVWVPCEIRLSTSRVLNSYAELRLDPDIGGGADESAAISDFLQKNARCIRPLPASPVEFVSEATYKRIEMLFRIAMQDGQAMDGDERMALRDRFDAVMVPLRGPLAAGKDRSQWRCPYSGLHNESGSNMCAHHHIIAAGGEGGE